MIYNIGMIGTGHWSREELLEVLNRKAVHVKSHDESRAVQDFFFRNGFAWGTTIGEIYLDTPIRDNPNDAALEISMFGFLGWCYCKWYESEGFQILSFEEFIQIVEEFDD